MSTSISKLFKSSRPYIKPECEHNIITYKYNGQCDSLYYAYIQSPMCDAIVEKLPTWLAPNLITMASFSCIIIPHLIMVALYGNATEGPLPSWFCVFLGMCFFGYNTLDNCDGK